MHKKLILALLSLVIMTTAAYAAPDRTGKWDAGVSVAGALSTDDEIDSTVQIGGNVAYGVTEWFAVGFEGGWQNHGSDDAAVAGTTIAGPDITGVPLFGDLIFRVPTGQEQFTPYGIVGLGVVVWDADDIDAVILGVPVHAETDIDTEFAAKLGGGLDWFLNDNWILNFEVAYVFTNPNATATATGGGISVTVEDDVDLDYWTIGGGLKFVF